MKRVFLCLVSCWLAITAVSAQFKIDVDSYERQKQAIEQKQREQDSLRRVQQEEQRLKENDIRFRLKWVNWITYKQSVGYLGGSHKIAYSGYLKTRSEWTIPVSLTLSNAFRLNESAIDSRYDADTWHKYLMDLGLSGFRKLTGDFYLSLGGQLPLGWERYQFTGQTNRHTHFLIGLGAEERVFYQSPNQVGPVIGFGFYQQALTSKLCSFDYGLSIDIGIKF
jgi:hypothetical protein